MVDCFVHGDKKIAHISAKDEMINKIRSCLPSNDHCNTLLAVLYVVGARHVNIESKKTTKSDKCKITPKQKFLTMMSF